MTLPPDLPDDFEADHESWVALEEERTARRIQWLMIAGFLCAVAAGVWLS